jgi:hypothetical protein
MVLQQVIATVGRGLTTWFVILGIIAAGIRARE